ncbi:MAG: hypothetical protein ABL872_14115 [Lacibacter sp.]
MKIHNLFSASILAAILLFTTSSCNHPKNTTQIIEGDLYFNWLRIGSLYNQPDSIIQGVHNYADTVNRNGLDSFDLRFLFMYDKLKSENLLYSPFVEIKVNNDSIITLYLSKNDYDKIKVYHRQDLIDINKKIVIKAETKFLAPGMVYCSKLLSVEKVDGITEQRDSKLKIEDYY